MQFVKHVTLFTTLLSMLFISSAYGAAEKRRVDVKPKNISQSAEHRIALVIGNSNYRVGALRNPVNDARAIAATLRSLGFEVDEQINLSYQDMGRAINRFGKSIRRDSVALFYYAGHGLQVQGSNYLVPVDTDIQEEGEVQFKTVNAGLVLAKMEDAKNPMNILILDACRDNPFGKNFRSSSNRGLAQMDAPVGSFVAYATAPGKTASDGPGKNGLYTEALIRRMKAPGFKIEEIFKSVRAEVQKKSGGKQVPWESSSLVGDFYFSKSIGAVMDVTNPSVAKETILVEEPAVNDGGVTRPLWDRKFHIYYDGGKKELFDLQGFTGDCDGYSIQGIKYSEQGLSITIPWEDVNYIIPEYGKVFLGNGHTIASDALKSNNCQTATIKEKRKQTVAIAGYEKVMDVEIQIPLIKMEVITINEVMLEAGKNKLDELKKLEEKQRIAEGFVFVKGGCFHMGDNLGIGYGNEQPVHEVCLNDYYLGKKEVTQSQWEALMGSNPSSFKNCGSNCAVENVSWNDTQDFIKRLNDRTGKNYRLPTEAEWEYAARSGRNNEKYAGTSIDKELGDYAWYFANSGSRPHPVGEKKPNIIGLYDMTGNLWEWCQDWYGDQYYSESLKNNPQGPIKGSSRVLRGGSWSTQPESVRNTVRGRLTPTYRNNDNGFRLALSSEQSSLEMNRLSVVGLKPSTSALNVINSDYRFIAYANGTVLDTKTNLMWASKDNGADVNWNDAKRYCDDYRGGSYEDWRMPTQDELTGLYDKGKSQQNEANPSYPLHLTDLINLTACCPWASEINSSVALIFRFNDGSRWGNRPSSDGNLRALPVRNAK